MFYYSCNVEYKYCSVCISFLAKSDDDDDDDVEYENIQVEQRDLNTVEMVLSSNYDKEKVSKVNTSSFVCLIH